MKKNQLFATIILVLIAGVFAFLFFQKKPVVDKLEGLKNMIQITSPSFSSGGLIPKTYSCDGENINPLLVIKKVPQTAKSLVLIVDDPDAPAGTWTHWLVWNIDPETTEIKENSVPVGAVLGKNDFGKLAYGGPCPPGGSHRYFFRLYALDTVLNLPQGASRKELETAMSGHIVDQGELMGKYSR